MNKDWKPGPEALEVLDTLKKHHIPAWIAGGYLRDAIAGREPDDIDIAVQARPGDILAIWPEGVQINPDYGTVLLPEKMHVELTPLRGRTIEKDLARRDFTMDAIAWSPEDGLLDPLGGAKDIEAGIIREAGYDAFLKDPLRLLRAYWLQARGYGKPDEQTEKDIHKYASLLETAAPERIVPLLETILKEAPDRLEDMTDLLQPWIPELQTMKETEQNTKYHYTDVLHHTIDALKQAGSDDPAVLWALLLHDIGKPETKTTDEKGDHFKKHPLVSTKIARRVAKELKLSKKLQKEIPELVLHHDSFYRPDLKNIWKLRHEKGFSDEMMQHLFAVQRGDILAHATHDRLPQLEAFEKFYNEEKQKRPLSLKELKAGGREAEEAGFHGSQAGEALEQLLKHMFYHPQENTLEGGRKYLAGLARQKGLA